MTGILFVLECQGIFKTRFNLEANAEKVTSSAKLRFLSVRRKLVTVIYF